MEIAILQNNYEITGLLLENVADLETKIKIDFNGKDGSYKEIVSLFKAGLLYVKSSGDVKDIMGSSGGPTVLLLVNEIEQI